MLTRITFGLVLIASPAVAVAAQDNRSQEQVEAVLRCIDIPSVELRVRCYDSNAVALRDSLRTGQVAIVSGAEQRERAPTPSRVDAAVTTASATASGGWRIELDNGQVWQTYESQRRDPPPAGSQARIRRNLIGSLFLTIRGYGEARVFRVQ
jgi:hypothetical protein